MKKPSFRRDFERDLGEFGISELEYKLACENYQKIGASLAKIPNRGYRVFFIHKNLPKTFVLWSSLGSLVLESEKICEDIKLMIDSD